MGKRVAMLRSKSVGGVEPRLDREARTLAQAGYAVRVVLWDRDVSFRAREIRDGYEVHRVRYRAPYNRLALAWKLPRWWGKAYRLLESFRPEIVHAADYDSVPPALRARRRLGSKFVFDVWDFYADMITARVPRFVKRDLARREAEAIRDADLVILPDLAGRRRLAFEPRRLIEIMNVPQDQTVVPEPHDRFTLFYGGNLSRDRGLLDILRACEATGAAFLVAGQGPDEAQLLPLIESSPNARFLGQLFYEDVLRNTASADAIPILYDPSVAINRLASPNKLYEAMMFSKPVIVSEDTRMARLVRDEGIGLTVPYGGIGPLREALERLMSSPNLCADLGERGRRLYETRYRWDIMASRLVEAYERL